MAYAERNTMHSPNYTDCINTVGITRKFVMLSLNWNRRDWCFFRVAIARPILRAYRDVIERSGAVPAVIALLFVAAQAHAGEIEPRAYVNTPVGINFLLAGYAYSDGGLSTAGFVADQGRPTQDAYRRLGLCTVTGRVGQIREVRCHTALFPTIRKRDGCGSTART